MVHEKYVLQVHIYKPFHIDFCANYVPFSSVSDGVVDKCLIIVTKVYRYDHISFQVVVIIL